MEVISGILSILGSSAIGSVIGGAFALLNKKNELELKKLDQTHELAIWQNQLNGKRLDIEIMKEELAAKKDIIALETDSAIEVARMSVLEQAQGNEGIKADELKAAGKYKWLLVAATAVNKFIRPGLTIAVGGAAIYVNLKLLGVFLNDWGVMGAAERSAFGGQALAFVSGQAGVMFAYWFVSRGSSK